MALRFRRSIKLAPGVRWNFSSGGSSWTLGPRGASVNIGKRGTYANTKAFGFGPSTRQRLSGPKQVPRTEPTATRVSLTCSVDDNGILSFSDAQGNPAPDHLVNAAKKQNKDALLGLITQKCEEINANLEALGRLHHDTPDANAKPRYDVESFDIPEPTPPTLPRLGFIDKLFAGRRRRIAEKHAQAMELHAAARVEWDRERAAFDAHNEKQRELVERRIYVEPQAMEQFLEQRLQEIVWPRETLVAMELADGGQKVLLDVDLPEVEDMPTKLAAVPSRGLKLSVKELSATKVQRLYMEHVHSVMFRLIGESFAALPLASTIVASGYSQRRDPGTGVLRDDYLLSVRVARSDWVRLDFSALATVDVVEALSRFALLRNMSKTGIFKPIAPHSN
ncbi:DUF4236 domain-containing protein [Sphaerotilaceae bacterium SBD11-9]